MSEGGRTRLKLRQYLAYALPAIPIASLTLPLYIIVPTFYGEVIGLSLTTVGFVLLLIRVLDALCDPVIGWLSDRFSPAFGRRRSFFIGSIPVTALAAFMLFWPPVNAGAVYLGLWGSLLSIGYTATFLPYTAWGAELSTDYQGRSVVSAFREGATLVGTLIAIILPFAVGMENGTGFHGLAALSLFIVVLLPISSLVAVSNVIEPPDRSIRMLGFVAALWFVFKNTAFIRLVVAFLINGLSNAIPATLFLYFVSDRLGAPDMRGPFLFLYFLFGIAGVPFAVWCAARVGKHRAWCYGMGLACIIFFFAGFLGTGDIAAFGVICALTGFLLGFDLALPGSIQADVIDVDTASTGSQRTGFYIAAWSLATKLALALAVGLVFPILHWSGFESRIDGQPGPFALDTLALLYAWLPIAFKLVAIAIMWNFPLDEQSQNNLRQRIETKRTGEYSSKATLPTYPIGETDGEQRCVDQ